MARFRLIAATNRPLERLVREASGRSTEEPSGLDADFFDRISTFVLHIPPLRERRADLPALWRSALQRAADECGLADREGLGAVASDRSTLAALEAHPLPGNIRDLLRAAWHAVADLVAGRSRGVAGESALRCLEALPLAATSEDAHEELPSNMPAPADLAWPIHLDEHLGRIERELIEHALDLAGGNKSRAAQLLGLARKTFEYRAGRHRS